jgi:hypothetical protein
MQACTCLNHLRLSAKAHSGRHHLICDRHIDLNVVFFSARDVNKHPLPVMASPPGQVMVDALDCIVHVTVLSLTI